MSGKTQYRYLGDENGSGKKLLDFAARIIEKPDCETCRALHELKGRTPDCDECLPELLPVNYDAWRVYQLVQTQVIAGVNGVIDLNHLAIWEIIDRYRIANPVETFEKVVMVGRQINKLLREKDSQ